MQDKTIWQERAGACMVAGASVLYGIIPLLVKKVLLRGMAVSCVMAYRFLLMAVLTAVVSVCGRKSMRINVRQGLELGMAGTFGIGMTNFLLGCAYLHIEMWMATVCHFIYPIIVMFNMYLFYHQKMNANEKKGAVLTAAGFNVLLLFSKNASVSGVIFAVLSGVAYGFYMICMEKASFINLEKTVIICYLSLACAICFFIQSLLTKNMSGLTDAVGTCLLAGSAAMSVMAMLLLTRGVEILGASRASYLNLLEPVSNICADFVFYKMLPTALQFVGCSFILGAVFVVSLPEKRYHS